MSETGLAVISYTYLRFFQNETGKRTLNIDVANKWLIQGSTVTAVLTNHDKKNDFHTGPLTSISDSITERAFLLTASNNVRYIVKRKYPGDRYVSIDHYEHNGLEIKPYYSEVKNKELKGSLEYTEKLHEKVKKMVESGKKVIAVYYESRDCKTITANIKEVDFEKGIFVTETDVTYHLQ